jgi:hypothetical protein
MEERHAPVRPALLSWVLRIPTGTFVPFISIVKASKIIDAKNKCQDFVRVYNALAKFWATPQPAPMLALRNLRPIYIIFYLFIYIRESVSGGAYFSVVMDALFCPSLLAFPKITRYIGRKSRKPSIHGGLAPT